jgi:hypothetical protein
MRALAGDERLDVLTDTALGGGLHEDDAVRRAGTCIWKQSV